MNYAENEDAKCITVVERGPLNDLLCNAADSVKEAKRLREENAALLAEVEALRARCERLAALARTLNTPQQWAAAAAARSGVTFTPMAAADVAAAMAALHPGDTEEAK